MCNEGFEFYFSKCGILIMGGVMIFVVIIIIVLLWVDLINFYVWVVFVVLFGYGVVGFVDDYCKVVCKNIDGLIVCWKYFW